MLRPKGYVESAPTRRSALEDWDNVSFEIIDEPTAQLPNDEDEKDSGDAEATEK